MSNFINTNIMLKSNLPVLIIFLIPFIILACCAPGISGAFIFSGVFSLFMYINLIVSAKINAKIGGESGMEKNSFFRFLFIVIFSISFAVVVTI